MAGWFRRRDALNCSSNAYERTGVWHLAKLQIVPVRSSIFISSKSWLAETTGCKSGSGRVWSWRSWFRNALYSVHFPVPTITRHLCRVRRVRCSDCGFGNMGIERGCAYLCESSASIVSLYRTVLGSTNWENAGILHALMWKGWPTATWEKPK